MKRDARHVHAGSRRRGGADVLRRSTLRKLIYGLAAGMLAPLSSFAQQQRGKVFRIGFLSSRSRPPSIDADFYGGFLRGMHERGYLEGKNVVYEWRFANGNPDT